MKISILIASLLIAATATAKNDSAAAQSGWKYELTKGIAKSTRLYLLVADPESKNPLRAEVQSLCEKKYPSESKFGQCQHKVTLLPKKDVVSLATGENVYFAELTHEQTVLATIQGGCCGSSNQINFYSLHGDPIGHIKSFKDFPTPLDEPIHPMNSSGTNALLQDQKENFVVYNSTTQKTEPIDLNLPDLKSCNWGIETLQATETTLKINLILSGCAAIGPKSLTCKKTKQKWQCQ